MSHPYECPNCGHVIRAVSPAEYTDEGHWQVWECPAPLEECPVYRVVPDTGGA